MMNLLKPLICLAVFLVHYTTAYAVVSDWQWESPKPQGNNLRAVTYGYGQWVAVSGAGTLCASTDGISWTVRPTGFNETLSGIAWNGTIFVATGTNATILTSPDGTNWTKRSAGIASNTTWIDEVIWTGSEFLATAGTSMLTSNDGIAWVEHPTTVFNPLSGLAWDGLRYVGVSIGGKITSSLDGTTWQTDYTAAVGGRFESVIWNGTAFVAVGSTITSQALVVTSADGVNWNAPVTGITSPLQDIVWTGTQFVAVGSRAIATSTDGTTWSPVVSTGSNMGIAISAGTIMVVGLEGFIASSPDGLTWTTHSMGPAIDARAIAWDGSQYVAVGTLGQLVSSTDGHTWLETFIGLQVDLNDIVWSGSQFVVVGGSRSYVSTDGITWNAYSVGSTWPLTGITYGAGKFIAVGADTLFAYGAIYESVDGITWTKVFTGSTFFHGLRDVVWNGSKFVAVGDFGLVATSADGVNWVEQSPAAGGNLNAVAWNGQVFVAVGDSILRSANGVTWTVIGNTSGSILHGIHWGNGKFVAVGEQGAILASTDGSGWNVQSSWNANTSISQWILYDAIWNGSQYVIAGNNTVLSSLTGGPAGSGGGGVPIPGTTSSGGGGCMIQADTAFDPLLVGLLLLAAVVLVRKRALQGDTI